MFFHGFHSNWQKIILFKMHFIYFAFFFFQLSNIQITTEQTELLDLPVPKVTEERNVPIDLPVQGVSGGIGRWWVLANEGSKRYREFMNLTVEKESVVQESTRKRNESQYKLSKMRQKFCPIMQYDQPYRDSYRYEIVQLFDMPEKFQNKR
ncbi:zinc finger protein [Loa loa]|uniref:Zinc finger protein n=1 Tax=Loa loa TaxID=7209 RepID=A0A1S0UAQ6_LOALO|nr:zinc finger protein [Loa loa]EFO27596.1 zinc finger protein [Loa loa]